MATIETVETDPTAELTQAAGGWDLSFRLAPEDRRGQYLSFFSLGVTIQTIAGPWLVTTAVLPFRAAGWAVLGAVLAVLAWLAGRLPASRADARP